MEQYRPEYDADDERAIEHNWDLITHTSIEPDRQLAISFGVEDEDMPSQRINTVGLVIGHEENENGRWVDLKIIQRTAYNLSGLQSWARMTQELMEYMADPISDEELTRFLDIQEMRYDLHLLTNDIASLPVPQEPQRYRVEAFGANAVLMPL